MTAPVDFNPVQLRHAIAALRAAWHETRKGPAEKLRAREVAYQWTSILAQAVELFEQHPQVQRIGFDRNPPSASVNTTRMVIRAQLQPGSMEAMSVEVDNKFHALSQDCTLLMRTSSTALLASLSSEGLFAGLPATGNFHSQDPWLRPDALCALLETVAGEEFRAVVREAYLQGTLPIAPTVSKPRM